jgi:EAL domain
LILEEQGFSPDRLEIEVAESALVREVAAAESTLGTLHDAGVRITLDNFGTGYSTLYHKGPRGLSLTLQFCFNEAGRPAAGLTSFVPHPRMCTIEASMPSIPTICEGDYLKWAQQGDCALWTTFLAWGPGDSRLIVPGKVGCSSFDATSECGCTEMYAPVILGLSPAASTRVWIRAVSSSFVAAMAPCSRSPRESAFVGLVEGSGCARCFFG